MNSNQDRLRKTLALFERYGYLTIELYEQILKEENLDFDYHRDGVLMVYTNQNSLEKQLKTSKNNEKYTILNKQKLHEYLPFLKENSVKGSVLLKRNAHLDPALMMTQMHKLLEMKGVEFLLNEEVIDLELENTKISKAITYKGAYEADTFIMATGSNVSLTRKLDTKLMMIPAKGYSITFELENQLKPKTVTLFADQFMGCTPRKNNVRLTSSLEIASKDPGVIQGRINHITRMLKNLCIDFEMKNEKAWAGYRPLTPNDIPLIGRDEHYKNLIYATGLGWLGITFGPVVGKIISELVMQNKANNDSTDILLFSGFYQGS